VPLKLPEPLAAYFRAEKRDDPEAVAQCFAHHAVVRDEGRTITGVAAIREWMTDAKRKYGHTVEPLSSVERRKDDRSGQGSQGTSRTVSHSSTSSHSKATRSSLEIVDEPPLELEGAGRSSRAARKSGRRYDPVKGRPGPRHRTQRPADLEVPPVRRLRPAPPRLRDVADAVLDLWAGSTSSSTSSAARRPLRVASPVLDDRSGNERST
jgi:hypothetical protein